MLDSFQASTTNFTLTNGNTDTPTFTAKGGATSGQNLAGNSAIGATLTLVNPGDSITFTDQISLVGNSVQNGNLQLRYGLLYDNGSLTDTNWLGYFIGWPNANSQAGLYMRNNPNSGFYVSGTGATNAQGTPQSWSGTVSAGTYNYSLSITLLSVSSDLVSWNITGPSSFAYSGTYTNTSVSTKGGLTFDEVGFLCGTATWSSPSTNSDAISFLDPTVTLVTVPEPSSFGLVGLGLAGFALARIRRCRR
jgi:hypothetical protein